MAPTDNGWHLEQSWPGLVADRDGVEYAPAELVKVASALWAKFPELYGSDPNARPTTATRPGQGSQPDVEGQGASLQVFADHLEHVKRWDGGKSFAAALMQGHKELTTVYEQVNEKLRIAFALIDAGAGNYKRADAANGG
ncbi:hypothetical protein ACFFV7_09505 [Nonomuraea spiralis]|uniref:Uncharacterized protein n=1 Tax=Nonomuraea spiralis TaxID=46182 RepID=A0ABV5IBT7_9ACTN|nr:hypothetical protein [Nonomuraea spiralis]